MKFVWTECLAHSVILRFLQELFWNFLSLISNYKDMLMLCTKWQLHA